MDALMADPAQLSQVLLYHVAPGALLAPQPASSKLG